MGHSTWFKWIVNGELAMRFFVKRRLLLLGGATLAVSSIGSKAFAQQLPGPSNGSRRLRPGYGWIRDRPDLRDQLLTAPSFANPAPRPPFIDLSAKFPAAYDQGSLGSCTANAIAAAVQYSRRVHRKPRDFVPSRLFIYYYERKIEQTIYTDSGAQIRDGIRSVANFGVCPESEWPYDDIAGDATTHVFPENARAIEQPPEPVRREAVKYKTISYAPLGQHVAVLESCLAAGYPFIFGFTVYDNLTETTTLLRTPGPNNQITPYGHAVLAVGYNQARQTFRVRNSWGPAANSGGYFDMEYGYVLNKNLAADFWVVYQTLGFI